MKPSEELPDPRHQIIRARILELYFQHNQDLKCPWSGRTGAILKRILRNNPSWPVEALLRCVDNRFASEGVNLALDPVDWLDSHHERLVNYARSPLDSFKRPKFQKLSQEEVIQKYWEAKSRELN